MTQWRFVSHVGMMTTQRAEKEGSGSSLDRPRSVPRSPGSYRERKNNHGPLSMVGERGKGKKNGGRKTTTTTRKTSKGTLQKNSDQRFLFLACPFQRIAQGRKGIFPDFRTFWKWCGMRDAKRVEADGTQTRLADGEALLFFLLVSCFSL